MKIWDTLQNDVFSDTLLEIYTPINVSCVHWPRGVTYLCIIHIYGLPRGVMCLGPYVCNALWVFGPTLACIQTKALTFKRNL